MDIIYNKKIEYENDECINKRSDNFYFTDNNSIGDITNFDIVKCDNNKAINKIGIMNLNDNDNSSNLSIKCCGPKDSNFVSNSDCVYKKTSGKTVDTTTISSNNINNIGQLGAIKYTSDIGKIGTIKCSGNNIITDAGIVNDGSGILNVNNNTKSPSFSIKCCPLHKRYKLNTKDCYNMYNKYKDGANKYFLDKSSKSIEQLYLLGSTKECKTGYYATELGFNKINKDYEYPTLTMKCCKIKCENEKLNYPCTACEYGKIFNKNTGKCKNICKNDEKMDELGLCRKLCPDENYEWPDCTKCKYGYEYYGGNCKKRCDVGKKRNKNGECIFDKKIPTQNNKNIIIMSVIVGIIIFFFIILLYKNKNKI